ncbi:hypothetical protein Tco_1524034 [Tanacetum coccineum]
MKGRRAKGQCPTPACPATCDCVSSQYTGPSGPSNASNYKSSKYWAMKAVFENLEAEVDQNEIDLMSGEIERKNLLITNENLIAECLSKDVFYTTTDSVLNVSRFSDMHDAFTIAQQHVGNKKPVTSSDAPSFDFTVCDREKLNEQIQSRGNMIRELKEKISRLTKKNSDADPIFDLKALITIAVEPNSPRPKNNREVPLLLSKHLKESVETLREIVEDAKVERPLDTSLASACRYTKHLSRTEQADSEESLSTPKDR